MGRKKCPHVEIVDQDGCQGSRACLPGEQEGDGYENDDVDNDYSWSWEEKVWLECTMIMIMIIVTIQAKRRKRWDQSAASLSGVFGRPALPVVVKD